MIEKWFPTLIYYDWLKGIDNESLTKTAYSIKEQLNSNSASKWNCDTWNSLNANVSYDTDAINYLIYQTVNHANRYANEYEADLKNYQMIVTDFWFNIAEPNNYQEYHTHPNNHFSAVYYVKAQPNAGKIKFKNPDSVTSGFTIPTHSQLSKESGSTECCFYEPEPNKLLLFKSNLLHMVERNLSSNDRISVAMNLRLEPVGGQFQWFD